MIEIGAILSGGYSRIEEVFEEWALLGVKGTFDFDPVKPNGRSGVGVFAGVTQLIDVASGVVVGGVFLDANTEEGGTHGLTDPQGDGLRLFRGSRHLESAQGDAIAHHTNEFSELRRVFD